MRTHQLDTSNYGVESTVEGRGHESCSRCLGQVLGLEVWLRRLTRRGAAGRAGIRPCAVWIGAPPRGGRGCRNWIAVVVKRRKRGMIAPLRVAEENVYTFRVIDQGLILDQVGGRKAVAWGREEIGGAGL